MSDACNHDCSNCSENCGSRTNDPKSFLIEPSPLSKIKKVYAVVSGKGGVGKSLVTGLLASESNQQGFQTAVLDADVTGPSVPTLFGVHEKAVGDENGIYPLVSKMGIRLMSLNFLVEHETDPVVWRGPVISGLIQQFWKDVQWGEVDTMFIDMPPGTGDVPLTVFQSIPVNGIFIVTTPQELVSTIVSKAMKMANMMNIPILGLIENMSYFTCPDCGKEIHLFGKSHTDETAEEYGIPVLDRLPIDPAITAACDRGEIEQVAPGLLKHTIELIVKLSKE